MSVGTPLEIVFEDNHLLVLNKPAELATMGVSQGDPSLVNAARQYIKRKYHKPGNVYLGIVSRLDSMVTGLIVIARTSKAARRLTDQQQRGQIQKRYWALVRGTVQPPAGTWQDWLVKDDAARRMIARPQAEGDAKRAELTYRTLHTGSRGTLLEIELLTGRKHQIRVQAAARGWPVVGDRKYGSQLPFPRGIALHSRSLAFQHPVRDEWLEFKAAVPGYWPKCEGFT